MSIGKSSRLWFAASQSRQRCVSAKQKRRSSSALNRQRSLMFHSNIDCFAFHAAEAIEQCLVQRWMSVDSEHHLLHRRFELHGGDGFGDQLRRRRSDNVHAENFAVLLFGDDLDKSFVIADDAGLGIGSKREFAYFDLVSLL